MRKVDRFTVDTEEEWPEILRSAKIALPFTTRSLCLPSNITRCVLATNVQVVNALRLTIQHLEEDMVLSPSDSALETLKRQLLQRIAAKTIEDEDLKHPPSRNHSDPVV